VLAVLAPLVHHKNVVDVLRYLRDATLSKTPAGQRAVTLYYDHSREITALIARRPPLLGRAAAIVSALVDELRADGHVSIQTRDDATEFARALLPLASPHLRRDIEDTLQGDPWMLLRAPS